MDTSTRLHLHAAARHRAHQLRAAAIAAFWQRLGGWLRRGTPRRETPCHS